MAIEQVATTGPVELKQPDRPPIVESSGGAMLPQDPPMDLSEPDELGEQTWIHNETILERADELRKMGVDESIINEVLNELSTPGSELLDLPATETDPIFTGEEFQVAGLTQGVLRALLNAGNDPWNPSLGPRKTEVETGTIVEPPTTTKPKPDTPEAAMDIVGADVDSARETPRVQTMTVDEIAAEAEASSTLIKGSDLSMYDDTMSHQINFHLINGDDQLKATHATLAELSRVEINAARRGTMTHVEIEQAAQVEVNKLAGDLGLPPALVEKFLRREAGGDIPPIEQIVAARVFLEKSAGALKEMAWKIKKGEANDRDKLLFLSQWDLHRQLNAGYMGVRAEVGRSMHAFRQGMGSDVKMPQARMEEIVAQYSGLMKIDKVVDQVLAMETTAGVNRVVRDQAGGMNKWGAAAVEGFIGSVLSGVGTQVNNTGGNFLMLVRAPIDLQLAALFGIGSKYSRDKVYAGEAAAGMTMLLASWRKAFAAMSASFKSGEAYGNVGKFEMGHNKAISAEALGLRGPLGWMADVWGPINRVAIERVMGPIDAVFKVLNEQFTYGHIGYRQMMADMVEEGLTREEALVRLNKYLDDPADETVREAVEFGLYGTFQNPLGETGRAIQKAVNSSSLMKIIMPFVRTPTNIIKVGFLENTPLAFRSKEMKSILFPKPLDAPGPGGNVKYAPGALAKAQRARARLMFGTMVSGYFAMMALQGKVSGSGPKNSKERALLMGTGWRPRSILVRDDSGKIIRTISYDGIEPIGQTIGLVVDLVNVGIVSGHQDLDEDLTEQIGQVSAAALFAVVQNSVNKSYMYGVHEMMRAIEDPERYAGHHLIRTVNSFAPFSGLRRDIRRVDDPMKRQTLEILESLQNSVPGLSDNLPLRRNIWGSEMTYVSFFSNRYQVEAIDQDDVDLEMQELFAITKEVPISLSSKTIRGVKLDSEQYSILLAFRDTSHPELGMTRNFKEDVHLLMSNPQYADLSPYRKVEKLKGLQGKWDNNARRAVRALFPQIDIDAQILDENEKIRMQGQTREGTRVDFGQGRIAF